MDGSIAGLCEVIEKQASIDPALVDERVLDSHTDAHRRARC
jgi:hypothetical protein